MSKKQSEKEDPRPIGGGDARSTAGAISARPDATHRSAPKRPCERYIGYGQALSEVVFSSDNPDLTWLFTYASEEEIQTAKLDPELIDRWGLEIDDGDLPNEFKTIPEFIDYLKRHIKTVWESKPR